MGLKPDPATGVATGRMLIGNATLFGSGADVACQLFVTVTASSSENAPVSASTMRDPTPRLTRLPSQRTSSSASAFAPIGTTGTTPIIPSTGELNPAALGACKKNIALCPT
jgi:hypothetical protein